MSAMNALLAGRVAVFITALLPPCVWLYLALSGGLGPDPGKALLENLGQGTLILLLLTLCLTPLQKLTPWRLWARIRRQLGLWTFTYACLHFSAWLLFILGLDLGLLAGEIAEHPYILVGFAAWLLLLPLAITSNNWSMRKLGRNWKRLHRLAYLILLLGLLHLLWIVRSDWGQWLLYAGWALALMLLRWPPLLRRLQGWLGR